MGKRGSSWKGAHPPCELFTFLSPHFSSWQTISPFYSVFVCLFVKWSLILNALCLGVPHMCTGLVCVHVCRGTLFIVWQECLGWVSHHLSLWVSVWPLIPPLDEALQRFTNHGAPTEQRLNQPPWAAKWSDTIHLAHRRTCWLVALSGRGGRMSKMCKSQVSLRSLPSSHKQTSEG